MRSFWVPLQAFKVFHIIGMFNGMISTFRGWRLGVLNPIIHAILKFNEHHCRSRRGLANKNTCAYTIRNPKCCENNTTRTGSQDLHVCVCDIFLAAVRDLGRSPFFNGGVCWSEVWSFQIGISGAKNGIRAQQWKCMGSQAFPKRLANPLAQNIHW